MEDRQVNIPGEGVVFVVKPEAAHDRDCALNEEPWYMFNTVCTCEKKLVA